MKINLLPFLFLISLTIISCQNDDMPPEPISTLLLDQSISIDGIERNYHIQIPSEPTNKPIVMLLHGHTGSSNHSIGAEIGKSPQKVWLTLADENDFILVVPNGSLGPNDTRGWNDCRTDAPANPVSDDVKFLSELLDQLKTEYDYDDQRVYITGVSNGGFMSLRLVQEIPEKIAAFAAIVITMPVNSGCPDSNIPISALFMNGTEDPIAPYNGGDILGDRGAVQSTEESVNYWIARNNTDTDAIETTFPDLNEEDNSTVVKYVYPNGSDNTEVVLFDIVGGGHTEPSLIERYSDIYLALVGEHNGDIEMADEVWNFFKTKSK